jgi:site-specific DNA-methyltransferase (adenine-specific)
MRNMMPSSWKNKLYFGDNLDILREHVASESVDLIYLDPPFNSNATYNVLFQEKGGEKSAAQITAFEDTWHWGVESEYSYQEMVKESPQKLADLMQAMRTFLGQNDMMAYLVMIAQRMLELHRVLKPTGSIYLHCDPTASHYLKILMDSIFDPKCFVNEIMWQKIRASKAQTIGFGKVHDILLYYSRSERMTFNPERVQHAGEYIESHYRYTEPQTNRVYRLDNFTQAGQGIPRSFGGKLIAPPPGKHWIWSQERIDEAMAEGTIVFSKNGVPSMKRYLDEVRGNSVEDVWIDIPPINSQARERLGYPTQKPEALLERMIKASSNEGDLFLDPFCGCGTSISVAERLKRRWIGIDITHLAITLMKHRLEDTFHSDLLPYEVIGDPKDLESARALAQESQHDGRYQFEWWALGLVDARPAQDKKKGADKGVDGYINFFDDNSGKAKTVIVQVKSGGVHASYVQALRGAVEREKAPIGILITLEEPTKPMLQEAAASGFYEPEHFPGQQYPRLQILTIRELLEGKEAQYPHMAPSATFKRAQRHRKSTEDQQQLI